MAPVSPQEPAHARYRRPLGRFRPAHRHRRGLHRLAARPTDERVLHGRAGARSRSTIRSSSPRSTPWPRPTGWPPSGRSSAASTPRSPACAPTASCMCRPAPDDLVAKHEMQRELGRRTGTCFQRCVGLDAIGACHSVTFDIDAENGTDYHQRFLAFLKRAQTANIVIGGAMTDPEGRPLASRRTSRPTPTCSCASSSATRTASTFPAPRCTRPARSTRTG